MSFKICTATRNGEIFESSHTVLSNCCRSSKISENSGLKNGSRCQHLLSRPTNLGWEWLGIDGRRPWKSMSVAQQLFISNLASPFVNLNSWYASIAAVHITTKQHGRWLIMKRICRHEISALILFFFGVADRIKILTPPPPVLVLMQGIRKHA
jgi:hypothetical protein